MSAVKCSLLLTFLSIQFGISSSLFCYWNNGCLYKYFSSKTPYNFIRGDIRDSRVDIKGCEPVSIWNILRHGKRRPGEDFYKPMKEAVSIRKAVIAQHAAGQSSLCAQDVENLKNWNEEEFNTLTVSSLTPEGYNEIKDLSKRLRQAFSKLFDSLEESNYKIKPSCGTLLEDTANAYIAGLNNSQLSYTKPTIEFDNMAPYFSCKKYQKEVRKSAATYAEADKYKLNLEYLATKERIQRRIGIDFDLSDENITALYDLCRYDTSGYGNNNNLSPWCPLFTTQDLKVLEYITDLRHYYRNGYGLDMAEKLGRFPLKNLLKSFKQAKEGTGMKLTTYISHATMMDMMYTAMGLFKDQKPLNGEHRDPDRKWKSSRMSTFSTNMIAVLNKCTMDPDEYKVLFYMNEEPLLSICTKGVCTWEEFVEKFTFDDVTLDFCNLTSVEGETDLFDKPKCSML